MLDVVATDNELPLHYDGSTEVGNAVMVVVDGCDKVEILTKLLISEGLYDRRSALAPNLGMLDLTKANAKGVALGWTTVPGTIVFSKHYTKNEGFEWDGVNICDFYRMQKKSTHA